MAKKIVVVGDDKQISPEIPPGIEHSDVHALAKEYLSDIPNHDLLEQSSLFDQADVRFQRRIVLKEHFRCVPEIIDFSNKLCYRDDSGTPQLIPLRKIGGHELHPPLRTTFVSSGFRGEGEVNEPEADALVEEISRCSKDPAYDNKTFGVIALTGTAQSEYIHRKLIDKIGIDEMQKRRIVCGNAYSFQGDERNVMFLSMVVSNDKRYNTLTGTTYQQRFNVATSRAKDQMWLFHSVSLNDLKPDCIRHKLLDHCTQVEADTAYLLDDELKKCDSEFERQVARRIWQRGYRVFCQVEEARYKIDIVVEGENGDRLAIECDGDHFHGPDRYEADLNRQRILERCGWTFWRIWGSEFSANPDTSLDSLWHTLKELNILPKEAVR